MHDLSILEDKKSGASTLPIRLTPEIREKYETLAKSRAARLGLKGRAATLSAFFFHHIDLMIAYSDMLEGAELQPSQVALLIKDPYFQAILKSEILKPLSSNISSVAA